MRIAFPVLDVSVNPAEHSQMMVGSHTPQFVVLSIVIAALASYAALDLAGRVRSAAGTTRIGWLGGGATVMGLGIWSMHFVAMLAFRLPVPIAYELPQLLLSVGVGIGASLLALIVVSRAELRAETLVAGAVLMGGAIAGMHYIGMASMHVSATLTYTRWIVALSIVIAIGASAVALALAFSFRSGRIRHARLLKTMSAIVMGMAIAGMHYTAMAAVHFAARAGSAPPTTRILATRGLGIAVVIGTLVMLALAIAGAVIDRNMQSKIAFARELERINRDLQASLLEAEVARRGLAAEHEANLELQRIAQQETAKARWLAGVAETATALAHEVNNPLTTLLINAELLESADADEASQSIAEIRNAARRIARVIERLATTGRPRSIAYLGKSRMLDLSSDNRNHETPATASGAIP